MTMTKRERAELEAAHERAAQLRAIMREGEG